ncbi:ABC transporter permease [Ruminococcus sp.]|uniref:ABC transporter permease n=1 Tax=Ruminococcus sp. TaxID=41978 RepID=UPI0038910694
MSKYLHVFKLYILDSWHYRFNTVVSMFFSGFNTMITVFFWVIVFESGGSRSLNSYSLKNIITYFVVWNIVSAFNLSNSGFYLNRMVKSGELNSVLIRPYSFTVANYFDQLSKGIIAIIPKILLTLVIFLFIKRYVIINQNIVNVLFVLVFLVVSTISSFMIWSILGCMSFWFEEAEAIMWSFAVLFNFLSGMFIPLDFFPKWISSLAEFLPTATWGYIPSKIIAGMYSSEKMLTLLCVNICSLIVLALIVKMIWNRGIRYYSSVGG